MVSRGNGALRLVVMGGGEVCCRFLRVLHQLENQGRLQVGGLVLNGILKALDSKVIDLATAFGWPLHPVLGCLDRDSYDAILSVGNSYIFTVEEIGAHRDRIVNFHAAPLPAYRGSACAAFALLNAEESFGASFHYVDATIDGGALIEVIRFPIQDNATSSDLDRLAVEHGEKQLFILGENLFNGNLKAKPQQCALPVYRRDDLLPYQRVELSWPEEKIYRHIRAFDWEGLLEPAYTVLNGQQVYLTTSTRGAFLMQPNE